MDKNCRLQILKDINGSENLGRVAESLRQVEIFNDRIYEHVYERLIKRFNKQTVTEIPICSSINLARRIAKSEASIYKISPDREWSDLSDDQHDVMDRIYRDMATDSKLLASNESFKLQNQNHVMIVPVDGKLQMRILRSHHLDSIDDPMNPEKPLGYVISALDKNRFRRNRKSERGGSGSSGHYDSWSDQESNFSDESIGDADDFQKLDNRYVVWTKEFNFIMNGKGEIVSGDEVINPLGMVPIVDISIEKDFEYWVRQGDSLTEFTIEHNELMSFISQVVLMEGFSQAYLIAKDDTIPQNLQIGPNFVLKLPVEEGSTVRPEFGYASPNADIGASMSFAESKLAQFLSSRGADTTLISGKAESNSATSGIDRLLKQIETFEASRSDFDNYKAAEGRIYEIIKGWHNVSLGNDLLASKYQSTNIPEDSELSIQYAGPEMVKTEQDKIDTWNKRIEAGESTVVDMMMDLRGVDKDMALELLKENSEIENQLMGDINGSGRSELTSNQNSDPRPRGDESDSEN